MTHSISRRVFCTLQFEALHRWPGAVKLPEVAFLAHPHRHVFHVRAEKKVHHNDRDIEFIMLKRQISKHIDIVLKGDPHGREREEWDTSTWSCEQWAEHLLLRFDLDRVEVSEDGESGAVLERTGT